MHLAPLNNVWTEPSGFVCLLGERGCSKGSGQGERSTGKREVGPSTTDQGSHRAHGDAALPAWPQREPHQGAGSWAGHGKKDHSACRFSFNSFFSELSLKWHTRHWSTSTSAGTIVFLILIVQSFYEFSFIYFWDHFNFDFHLLQQKWFWTALDSILSLGE